MMACIFLYNFKYSLSHEVVDETEEAGRQRRPIEQPFLVGKRLGIRDN